MQAWCLIMLYIMLSDYVLEKMSYWCLLEMLYGSFWDVNLGTLWYEFCFAEEVPVQIPMMKSPLDKIQLTPGQALPPGFPGPFIFADSLSSVETLLTNIQVNNISINKINVIQDISTYINYFIFEKLKQIRWTACHLLYFYRVYWKWLWIMLVSRRNRFNKKRRNCE